jgi:hypothetical protein
MFNDDVSVALLHRYLLQGATPHSLWQIPDVTSREKQEGRKSVQETKLFTFKRKVSRDGYFFEGLKNKPGISVGAVKLFSLFLAQILVTVLMCLSLIGGSKSLPKIRLSKFEKLQRIYIQKVSCSQSNASERIFVPNIQYSRNHSL